jgi:ribonuclease D
MLQLRNLQIEQRSVPRDVTILDTSASIAAFCATARPKGRVGLDMEFERERSYRAALQLIQLSTVDQAVVVDPLADADLGPVWDLVADDDVELIVHAGMQDMEIFHDHTGQAPRNVFDTQIAAALLGMGEQPGYADLVRRVLDVRVKKGERTTRWGRRPLSAAQLQYALDDVRYLHPLYASLRERLQKLGRLEWVAQELAFYADERTYTLDEDRLWMRVSRHRTLSPRRLAVLRELALWRERTAQHRNIPRARVVPDDVLVDIARRLPEKPGDLEPLRRMPAHEISRSGRDIVAAVARGLAVPEEDQPRLPQIPREDRDLDVTVDLLALVVRHRAREAHIATSYLASKRDINRLVEAHRSGHIEDSTARLLHGWRRELAGRDCLKVLEGRLTLAVDPRTGYLVSLEEGQTLPRQDTNR